MREIKFRAWDERRKKFVPEFNVTEAGSVFHINSFETCEPLDVKIMQYTGLKDRHGKEIYEGDIVTLTDKDDIEGSEIMTGTREVVWNIQEARFEYSGFVPLNWGGFASIEVIGNIYENANLLTA